MKFARWKFRVYSWLWSSYACTIFIWSSTSNNYIITNIDFTAFWSSRYWNVRAVLVQIHLMLNCMSNWTLFSPFYFVSPDISVFYDGKLPISMIKSHKNWTHHVLTASIRRQFIDILTAEKKKSKPISTFFFSCLRLWDCHEDCTFW